MKYILKDKHKFTYAFLTILILDILFIQIFPAARWVTKPLIMISLFLYYQYNGGSDKYMIFSVALVFAWLGDVFLLLRMSQAFMLGLVSFLLMQLLYAIFFFHFIKKYTVNKLLVSLVVVLIAVAFNVQFFNDFGDFQIPVIVYSAAICIMVVMAVLQELSDLIRYGAILFMFSDLLLAYNKFIQSEEYFDILVMLSYGLGQLLIVKGSVKGNYDHS